MLACFLTKSKEEVDMVRYTKQFWMKHVAQQPASGLSVTQYCERNGIERKSFYNWQIKARLLSVNAPTESLWSRLKVARVHGRKFATMAECKDEVMDWLHFYNSTRLHSRLGEVSPKKFEEQWHAPEQKRAA
jgi:transposase InsO family protein